MRTLKFRAWDGENMIPDTALYWNGKCFVGGCWSFYEDCIPAENQIAVEVMQYTGLKDKNGTEIYEGDIIAHMSTRRAGYQKDGVTIYRKIVFGEANTECSDLSDFIGFWAVLLGDKNAYGGRSIRYQTKSLGAVVIGNIHENTELLELDKESSQ